MDFIEDGLADAVVPMMKEANSPRHSLKLRSTRTGSVLIGVKDSGAGLTAEQLERICEEGVQFNANELQAGQGSGLGLFITKGIVNQHAGKLLVTSEGIGKGATFTVELPVYDEPHRVSAVLESEGISLVSVNETAHTGACFNSVCEEAAEVSTVS